MAFNKKAVRTVLDKAIKAGRSALSAAECKRICSAYDIPLPRDGMAASADKAAALAKRLGFPVVMKIVSEDILHKTDAGGVGLDVEDPQNRTHAAALPADTRRRDGPAGPRCSLPAEMARCTA